MIQKHANDQKLNQNAMILNERTGYDPLNDIMRLSRLSTSFIETGMKPSLDALTKSQSEIS
jgi:hypothetical protein